VRYTLAITNLKERTNMQQIDKELRHAIMDMIHAVATIHPALKTNRPTEYECGVCARADALLALLDAEQREYGPPIDVTDPSWLREHPTGAPA
jgi:hypothetical protein